MLHPSKRFFFLGHPVGKSFYFDLIKDNFFRQLLQPQLPQLQLLQPQLQPQLLLYPQLQSLCQWQLREMPLVYPLLITKDG